MSVPNEALYKFQTSLLASQPFNYVKLSSLGKKNRRLGNRDPAASPLTNPKWIIPVDHWKRLKYLGVQGGVIRIIPERTERTWAPWKGIRLSALAVSIAGPRYRILFLFAASLHSLFSRVWGFPRKRDLHLFFRQTETRPYYFKWRPGSRGTRPPLVFSMELPVQLGGRRKTKTRYFNTLKTAMGNSTPKPLKGTRILWDQTEMLQKNSLRLFVYDIHR